MSRPPVLPPTLIAVLFLLLAGCAAPPGLPDAGALPPGPPPHLVPTDAVLGAAGTDLVAPGDDAALAARAAALQARGARLQSMPVSGPPVP
jgi:hypothetical protein